MAPTKRCDCAEIEVCAEFGLRWCGNRPVSRLEVAAKNGDIQEVIGLLENDCTRVTSKALTLAIHNGHFKVAKKLVKHAWLNDDMKIRPELLGTLRGHTRVAKSIKFIMRHIPNWTNSTNKRGLTPLIVASGLGLEEAVATLLSNIDIKVNMAADNGVTALIMAAQNGHANVVKLLLEKEDIEVNKAQLEGTDHNYAATPLCLAAFRGYETVVELLLAKEGIDVNKTNDNGASPLFIAARCGHVRVVKLLLKHQHIDVNQANRKGATPLFIAAKNGHNKVVKHILQ